MKKKPTKDAIIEDLGATTQMLVERFVPQRASAWTFLVSCGRIEEANAMIRKHNEALPVPPAADVVEVTP